MRLRIAQEGVMMDLRCAMLFMLLAVPLVSAVPQGIGAYKDAGLAAAMDNVECKTDFMIGVMESMMEKVNDSSGLASQTDVLNSDVDALQGYADAGDAESFRTYVHGTYAGHMRDARQAIIDARKGLKGQDRLGLAASYRDMRDEYDSCNFGSLKRFADAKKNAYREAIEDKREKLKNLSAKGVDTSGLGALVDGAEDEIVGPLEEELSDAGDAAAVRGAFNKYCLYNGCPNGQNFHFAARFEAAKLEAIIGLIRADADDAGFGSDVAAMEGVLGSVQSELDAAGTSQISASEELGLWGDLKSVVADLKELISKLRSGE